MSARVLVAAVGSRACGDDAVGLVLAERLRGDAGVDVALWEDRDALDVAGALLEGAGPVVLVDCADMGLPPGSWRLLGEGVARDHRDTVSTHGFGLADALRLARALGCERDVRVFGVQPFDVRPGLVGLSDGLAGDLEELQRALREVVGQTVGFVASAGVEPRLVGVTVALRGLVQGVGMRPTVARLAREAGVGGWARNRAGSLLLRLEGGPASVRAFLDALPGCLPPHARLDAVEVHGEEPVGQVDTFRILPSDDGEPPAVVVPPDLAVCPACLAEVRDPADRRYGYPFTTCTACGPRYTVVERTPYDRERTTLARFPLCAACRAEYEDPGDRRHHAESIACPACGPRLAALRTDGAPLGGDPLRLARAALAGGGVVALRGLGGFQLLVDARRPESIERLRRLKARPHKPLAVMAASLGAVERSCLVPDAARTALAGPAAPIVLLDVREGAGGLPLGDLSPDTRTLGVMLPTTPLHDLLLTPLPGDPTPPFDWLVVTSGNRRGEPLCMDDGEALERLGFADLLLTHDRDIAWRCDDSVVQVQSGGPQVLRRARGHAPGPLSLRRPLDRCVLALGAGLKNTVALGFDDQIVLSPHIGDVDDPATLDACEALARALPERLGRRPDVVAVDLHPDLGATRLGERLAAELGVPVERVQHHHAHAAACMAEHGVPEALALTWDGVGLGVDGALWGGELLHVSPAGARRLGTFAPAPLPGGDAAVREPLRQLVGRLFVLGDPAPAWLPVAPGAFDAWTAQCRGGVNAPASHAVGRLFDAAAAALGLAPEPLTWEGQAAVRLEAAARQCRGPAMPLCAPVCDGDLLVVDWRPLLRGLLSAEPGARGAAALGLHGALAGAAVELVRRGMARTGPLPAALTGGVFQNRLLAQLVREGLTAAGFTVLEHALVPPNDGGISLGQAVIAGRCP